MFSSPVSHRTLSLICLRHANLCVPFLLTPPPRTFSCSLMSASLHPHLHTLPDTPFTPDYKVTEEGARSKQPFLPLCSARKASMQSLFWFHLFKRKILFINQYKFHSFLLFFLQHCKHVAVELYDTMVTFG